MPVGLQGLSGPSQVSNEIINDITAVALRIFPNEVPLITRLPRQPVGSVTFKMLNYAPRKRAWFLGTAIAATTDPLDIAIRATSGGSADVSVFQKGDVLEIVSSSERIEVSQVNASSASVPGDADSGSTSSLAANSIRVRRGKDGTAAAASGSLNDSVLLLGNSRTGGEVDQVSQRTARTEVEQYCQTFQFAVQVAGSVQSSFNAVLPPGTRSFFDGDKLDKLREMYRDMEYTAFYGGGEAPSAPPGRPKQKGLRTLISTYRVTSPTNAGTYKQTDFVRDMFENGRKGSGEIDTVFVSTNFMSGLAIWNLTPTRIMVGSTIMGTPVNVYQIPLLNMSATFIEAPQLKNFTAVGLTSSEIKWRNKRNEFWSPRGNRGDAFEGDWIAEGAVHLENEAHHVWLEGITAFASS